MTPGDRLLLCYNPPIKGHHWGPGRKSTLLEPDGKPCEAGVGLFAVLVSCLLVFSIVIVCAVSVIVVWGVAGVLVVVALLVVKIACSKLICEFTQRRGGWG